MNIKERIIDVFLSVLNDFDVKKEDIIIEKPKDSQNGDFSCNIAMKLARIIKKNPIDIANDIPYIE